MTTRATKQEFKEALEKIPENWRVWEHGDGQLLLTDETGTIRGLINTNLGTVKYDLNDYRPPSIPDQSCN